MAVIIVNFKAYKESIGAAAVARKAGADALLSASYILAGNYKEAVKALKGG